MSAISNRMPECWVEFTAKDGTRQRRHFLDAYRARAFYALKYKAGAKPRVKKA